MAAEIHTQEISLDSFDENGQLRMSLPFAYKDAVYVDDETGDIYDYSAWCQIVRVRRNSGASGIGQVKKAISAVFLGKDTSSKLGWRPM